MKNSVKRPIIFITMGDPNGIGPEIVTKAVSNKKIQEISFPVVIGSYSVLKNLKNDWEMLSDFSILDILEPNINYLIDLNNIKKIKPGLIDKQAGKASFEYIEKATELLLNNIGSGLVTSPVNKKAIIKAHLDFSDHTDYFAKKTKSNNIFTIFITGKLKIVFLTRHLPLKKALEEVKKENIVNILNNISNLWKKLFSKTPKIGVAALNPHGSDHGLFGNEEKKEIIPAIDRVKYQGLNVIGPIPADSIFYKGTKGEFDLILSLYHDQGHIAAKTYNFHKTITATLGLPFFRTSVDHGTAMDIAWKNQGNPTSLIEAIKLIVKLINGNW